MKKVIAMILTLVLLLGLVVPISAYAEDYPIYIMPGSGTFDSAVVKGDSMKLKFILMHPEQFSNNMMILEFYKGTADELMTSNNPVLIERREYPMSSFTNREINITWEADKHYSVGDYCVVGYLVSGEGHMYYQTEYIADLHVVSKPIKANDIGLAFLDRNYNFDYDFDFVLNSEAQYTITSFLLPVVNTDKERDFILSGFDTRVLGVAQLNQHGYVQISGGCAGSTDLTVEYGSVKKTFHFVVELDGLRMDLKPEQATLCIGQTDKPEVAYFRDYKNRPTSTVPESLVVPEWYSSNESVLKVEDGVVTAVGPGTATIAIVAGTAVQTADYTVRAHDLPADSPTVAHTATQPGYQEGKCAICGEENARNYIAPIFTDTTPDAWYAPNVDFVYENEIMNGMNANTFAPNKPMTRAMVATVLYRIAGSPESEGEIPFTDVVATDWYADAVRWAAEKGVVTGYADGTFLPNRNITREQFATILYRYSQSMGMDVSKSAELSDFPDAGNVMAYAVDAMRWAVGTGLVTGVASAGKTELRPSSNATRAQFATIVTRYIAMTQEAPQEEQPVR